MMKKIIPVIFIGIITLPGTLFSQKGVEDLSRFGHGEDSIRCVTNITLYRQALRDKKILEAAKHWEVVISECPYATEMIYSDGIRILKQMMENVQDPEREDQLFLRVMGLWDARIAVFAKDDEHKRKKLLVWKTLDMLSHKRDDVSYLEKGYNVLSKTMRDEQVRPSEAVVITFLSVSIALDQKGRLTNEELVSNFRLVNDLQEMNPEQAFTQLHEHPFYTLIKSSDNPDEFFARYSGLLQSSGTERLAEPNITMYIEEEDETITPQVTYDEKHATIQFPDSRRIALVIGNSAYEFGGDLPNPVNDANAMAGILATLGFKVYKYLDLNQNDMRRAIDQFGTELAEYDVGLFFYAGHGVQAKGFNYLIPVDAILMSEADVEYSCVRADRILGKMEGAATKTNIVILDACRNNPFERSWTRSPAGKGLAFMNAPTGSLIAYATSPGNTALDGTGQNGLYTSALLQYIVEPDITVLEMFQKVRTHVRVESDGNQVPWESTSLEGNFYFLTGEGLESTYPVPGQPITTGKVVLNAMGGSFQDERDNQTYAWVKIGEQIWMAENLNYVTNKGSQCYDNKKENCEKYGRLYTWESAQEVCPDGWHLPSDEEWNILCDYLDGTDVAGEKMKSIRGWDSNGNGTDQSGFSAFPGGFSLENSTFYLMGAIATFWSSNGGSRENALYREVKFNIDGIVRAYLSKSSGLSVRCVKD